MRRIHLILSWLCIILNIHKIHCRIFFLVYYNAKTKKKEEFSVHENVHSYDKQSDVHAYINKCPLTEHISINLQS